MSSHCRSDYNRFYYFRNLPRTERTRPCQRSIGRRRHGLLAMNHDKECHSTTDRHREEPMIAAGSALLAKASVGMAHVAMETDSASQFVVIRVVLAATTSAAMARIAARLASVARSVINHYALPAIGTVMAVLLKAVLVEEVL